MSTTHPSRKKYGKNKGDKKRALKIAAGKELSKKEVREKKVKKRREEKNICEFSKIRVKVKIARGRYICLGADEILTSWS